MVKLKRNRGKNQQRLAMKQIFDKNLLVQQSSEIILTDDQKNAALEWIDMINSGQLEEESANYENFKMIVLERILGYGRKEMKITGSISGRNPDFTLEKNKLCIEVKGTTQGLFEKQPREDKTYETPITQTHLYRDLGSFENAFCSNYRDFILL